MKGNVRHGLLLSLLGAIGVAACGPAPAPKKPATAVQEGPQPQSTEWLYATPGSSGVIKDECGIVREAVAAETKCQGELCQYGVNLGTDWLRTCRTIAPDQVSVVEQHVATMRQNTGQSAGQCGREAEQLIERGCPQAADCAEVAQAWATRCGEHATPLVVTMIEKRVERNNQAPIKLDTTSCDQIFAEVTKTTECSDDFDCQEKVDKLHAYQTRCATPGAPIPLENAFKQALLLEAAKQPAKGIPVNEGQFAPKENRLLLEDKKGFVVGVGNQVVPSVKLLMTTLDDSEFALPVKLARIFKGKKTPFELRLGRVAAPDAATLFRRFPSLRFEGQSEAQKLAAANRAIAKLNEVVTKTAQPEILAGLVTVMTDAAATQDDAEFREEVRKADKHLARAFGELARAKRKLLPSPRDPKGRVAFARRSWSNPFADVTAQGSVQMGAATPAVFADVAVLLPKSFAAYREDMDMTVGRARRKLQNAFERDLKNAATARANECAKTKKSVLTLEQQALDCAFSLEQCNGDQIEENTEKLDQAIHDHEVARAKLRLAILDLEKPDKKIEKALERCR